MLPTCLSSRRSATILLRHSALCSFVSWRLGAIDALLSDIASAQLFGVLRQPPFVAAPFAWQVTCIALRFVVGGIRETRHV